VTITGQVPTVDGEGEIDRFNPGFSCVITVAGVCTITISALELPISGGVNRADLIAGAIDVEVDYAAAGPGALSAGRAGGGGQVARRA
jgi:hypothetical protein